MVFDDNGWIGLLFWMLGLRYWKMDGLVLGIE